MLGTYVMLILYGWRTIQPATKHVDISTSLTRASREEALSSHQAYVKIDYQVRQGSQAFHIVRLALYWKPSRPPRLGEPDRAIVAV